MSMKTKDMAVKISPKTHKMLMTIKQNTGASLRWIMEDCVRAAYETRCK